MTEAEALALINRKEQQILVHSYIYYQLNNNLISDYTYDRWSVELVELIALYPKAFDKSTHRDAYATFDGSTGYDLPWSEPNIQAVGNRLVKLFG